MQSIPRDAALNFLVIRRDNIGDLVCTTPLLRALRTHFPLARIAALVNSYNARVLAHNPDVDTTFVYTKFKHRDTNISSFRFVWDRIRFLMRLRQQRIDYAIIAGAAPDAIVRGARLARLVGAQHVIAFSDGDGKSSNKAVDLPVKYPPQPAHEVENTFALLQPLGITGTPPDASIYADATEVTTAEHKVNEYVSGQGDLIGIQISSRKPINRWPAEKFIALIKKIHAAHKTRFLLLWAPGSSTNKKHPGDDEKAAEIKAALHDIPVIAYEQGPLGQLIADLSLCRTVVTSDGGAMHLAAALGKPIVCFFGDADSVRWRPWNPSHVLLQSSSRCVSDISVEEAYAAFKRVYIEAPTMQKQPLMETRA